AGFTKARDRVGKPVHLAKAASRQSAEVQDNDFYALIICRVFQGINDILHQHLRRRLVHQLRDGTVERIALQLLNEVAVQWYIKCRLGWQLRCTRRQCRNDDRKQEQQYHEVQNLAQSVDGAPQRAETTKQ